MKQTKRFAALALCLALLFALLPQISLAANADSYTELGVVEAVSATADITAPTLDGPRTYPSVTVTDPLDKGVEVSSTMVLWQKKNGDEWQYYYKASFEPGIYRLHAQLRSDSLPDNTYYRLTNSTTLTVDGTPWTRTKNLMDCYKSDGYGYLWFCSEEYDVRPEGEYFVTVSAEGNGTASASHVSAAPGTVVTLTATPNSQYVKLNNWEVISGGVTVSNDQFTMGNQDVVIKAHFETETGYDLGTVTEVKAEAEITPPSLGGKRTYPQFTVTDPADKGVNISETMVIWQKKTEYDWENYYDATFTPGVYRLRVQLRSDSLPNGSYYRLSKDTVLYVNGKAWEKSSKLSDNYASGGYGYLWFCSEEYCVVSASDCVVTVTLPTVGKHPVFTGESGNPERYSVNRVDYFLLKDDGGVGAKLTENDSFRRNKSYRVMVTLWRIGDWSFTDDTMVVINGREAQHYMHAEYYGTYYVDVKAGNPFVDVGEGDFFFNPVLWAVEEGVTGGTDETHFSPERTVMRADAMVFFWAAKNRPAHADIQSPFVDVKKKHWYYDAVIWAVENGITGGTDATHFSPKRTCSRSEILQFLYAAMEKPEYHIENPYSDVKPKHWYYDGAIWAYEFGLECGEDGKYNAKTPCTRGYVVTYLYRFITGQELAE